ncbi:MAG TPA: S26 family signal peptidase, partial [Acidimicrobiales bacterium]
WIIKRAVAVAGDPLAPHLVDDRARTFVPADRLVVLGDNPNRSYDSRDFGFVEPQRLFGVVFRRLTAGPRVDALVRARS